MNETHYIVISEKQGPATHPRAHCSEDSAIKEATRLANKDREDRFFVYKATHRVEFPRVVVTPLGDPDDEIPF